MIVPTRLDQSHRFAGIVANNIRQSVDSDRVRVPLRSNGILDPLLSRLIICEDNNPRCRAVSRILNGQSRENRVRLLGLVFGLVGFIRDGPPGDIARRDSVPTCW